MREAPPVFERLSVDDAVFLEIEREDNPMHLGAVAFLDSVALTDPDGRLQMDRLEALLRSRLHLLPRYRRRVVRSPVTGHPVWIDDEAFDARNHVRHVALPRGGGREALQRIIGGFFSQKLDRGRPLWEILLVEGLDENRVVAVVKAHHALMDGVSGIDFLILLLSPEPIQEAAPAEPWRPAPGPTQIELIGAELRKRVDLGSSWVRAVRKGLRNPSQALSTVRDYAQGFLAIQWVLRPGSPTPINRPINPNRHLRTLRVPLAEVKALRRAYGGTVNDMVVALAAGALRRLLMARGIDVSRLDLRATIPVSTRTDAQRGTLGNKVAVTAARLPVGEADPRARVRSARAVMDDIKNSKQALGTDVLGHVAEWTTVSFGALGLNLGMRATHLLLTNLRGPQDTFYCLESPLLEVYPVPELFRNQTLAMAVMSYAGHLHWGVSADGSAVADAEALVDCLRTEISELGKQAAADVPEPGDAEPVPAVGFVREIGVSDGPAWEKALGFWDRRLDQEAARLAADAFESLAEHGGEGAESLAWCARAHYYLADYAEDPKARRRHFERGARFGRRGLQRDPGHVPCLFWTAACAGGLADASTPLRRATLVPEILEHLRAVSELERDYYHGGLMRFMGQAFVRQPGLVRRLVGTALPNLAPAAVERGLVRSIEEGPPFVLTHQTLGQLAWSLRRDREAVEEAIRHIEVLDPDTVPALAPENRRDQPRALATLRALLD